MKIGGLQKFSLLDYPGHLSAIIFTQGCNFRCHFCYNPMLVLPSEEGKLKNIVSSEKDETVEKGFSLNEKSLFDFLKTRIGKLDAIVITGGEPTIHSDLPEFIERLRKLGFKIKLDTNGTSPEMLKSLLDRQLVDYFAMDLKTAPEKYDLAVGAQPDLANIKKSIIIIKNSGLLHEFRTTLVPSLVTADDVEAISALVGHGSNWFLQQFKPDADLVNPSFQSYQPYSGNELQAILKRAIKLADKAQLR